MVRPWPVQAAIGCTFAILLQPGFPACALAASNSSLRHPEAPSGQRMGSICEFTSGSKAGTFHDFAPMEAPIGSSCSDGAGSRGTIGTPGATSAPSGAAVNPQMGTVCAFSKGPRAGASQNYAPMKAPLGMSCSDGSGSSGTIVASAPAVAAPLMTVAADEQRTGTVCKFTSGPKAGTEQDYAPMHVPLNTACDDGAGSSGVMIAAVRTGTVCQFTAGPRTGTEQDYSPLHAPLHTACNDGAGSSGLIVEAPQMGSVCKFTSGPKAGTEHDYAPMHEPVNTACDDGSGSGGVIVASQQVGTICKFTAGPRAGSEQDYAPVHAPVNTACNDGAGSSGVILAAAAKPAAPPAATGAAASAPSANTPATQQAANAAAANQQGEGSPPQNAAATNAPRSRVQLGSVCQITSGPRAGTTYDFAPMKADVGALCNYGPDNTGVIIASPPKPAKNSPPRVYQMQ